MQTQEYNTVLRMLKKYQKPARTNKIHTIEYYYRHFIANHKFWTLTKINDKFGPQEQQKQQIETSKHIKKLKQQ